MPFCVSQKSDRSVGGRLLLDFRSAPAVNALLPAPVTMATHTSGLSRTSIQAFEMAS